MTPTTPFLLASECPDEGTHADSVHIFQDGLLLGLSCKAEHGIWTVVFHDGFFLAFIVQCLDLTVRQNCVTLTIDNPLKNLRSVRVDRVPCCYRFFDVLRDISLLCLGNSLLRSS